MPINEPMTLATDWLLGAQCIWLARRLWRHRQGSGTRCWSVAFMATASAAIVGGAHHGFLPWLGTTPAGVLWKITLLSIGLAAFAATVGTVTSVTRGVWLTRVRAVAVLQLLAYSVAVLLTDRFLLAVVDYSIAFLFVLAIHLDRWLRRGDAAARWVVAAVLVSFGAAGIQVAGLAPHPSFNHNDLYHVVQMLGMWLLYRGVRPEAKTAT